MHLAHGPVEHVPNDVTLDTGCHQMPQIGTPTNNVQRIVPIDDSHQISVPIPDTQASAGSATGQQASVGRKCGTQLWLRLLGDDSQQRPRARVP